MGEYADYEIDRMIDAGLNPERIMRGSRPKPPRCPKCGGAGKTRHTEFGWRRDCCGLWAWGKNAPLVDAETHQARQYAHRVFDGLWQSGLVDRNRAYTLLARELDLDPSACHMKLMDKETAHRVPAATHEIWKRLKQGDTI